MTDTTLAQLVVLTRMFQAYRPNHQDYLVYSVDPGEPHEPNVLLRAASPEDTAFESVETMLLAKSWILENWEAYQ